MYCPRCGEKNPDNIDKCVFCYADFTKSEISITQTAKKDYSKTIVGAIMAVAVLVICIILVVFNNRGVPNVIGTQESVAIQTLTSRGYIPVVKYESSSEQASGFVIGTNPGHGSNLNKGGQVTVYVSTGSAADNDCEASDVVIRWYHIYQSTDDDWNVYTPYIKNNYIYIKTEMKLNSSLSVALRGFGTASINDTFSKTVPIEYEYEKSDVTMGEYQTVTIRIPVSDLDVQKPTTLYCRLATYVGGRQKDIQLEFDITW